MSDIIVPGQKPEQPAYPQCGAVPTPQGVMFTIQLGPTVTITQLVSHQDMAQIEMMRRAFLKEMQENAEIARNVIERRI